ncbi:acetyl/propionyl/methylcrotonyl-CoA carboxylase subunit alpha [Rhodoligotrophos ferricapiens]|uniref:acetyl/propionyl/methylcrotonyl-CoA carboxylase subunit alpha n=1 Tax=Rhodoligotrophos ferricapiens TaxID=3069264 RepID=UPI00315C9445
MPAGIRTILVANRGEIAVRVLRTVKELGYRGIAVFSDADADAPHVMAADRAIRIGEAPVGKSYLSTPAIIAAARLSNADAIHPGYGFLSENAEFAAACAEAGIIFIGPSPEAIRAMGDKRMAKERMEAAGVPCIPGYRGADQSPEAMAAAVRRIGFPLMIKAAAGGGGRGIRLVHSEAELLPAMNTASSEARNAFGDGTLYLERALISARHIEVQIMGDAHGKVLHFGERDCSTQRRNQKILEEAPSPALNDEQRQRICADAVAAARSISYVGAGTVEFLLDQKGKHFFLEMNTRLQVEHPVTEMITGVDLVELQIRVATGQPLGLEQQDISFTGSAIEARLYAEDPSAGFLPQTGTITRWRPASGPRIRVDSGIHEGQSVTPFYDPMLAKIIGWGPTREDARRALDRALEDTIILGVGTNRRYLTRLLKDDAFVSGTITTDYLAQADGLARADEPEAFEQAVAALLLCWPLGMSVRQWREAGGASWRIRFDGNDKTVVMIERHIDGTATITLAHSRFEVTPITLNEDTLTLRVGDMLEHATFARSKSTVEIVWQGRYATFSEIDEQARGLQDIASDGRLRAPMSGCVVKVLVCVGDRVARGDCLVVLEAMKMETELRAGVDGVVTVLDARVGEQVTAQHVLAEISIDEAA